jgi:integrase
LSNCVQPTSAITAPRRGSAFHAGGFGIERFGAHELRRTCAQLCRRTGGDLKQIKCLLGQSSIQTTEHYWVLSEQEIAVAVNDAFGLQGVRASCSGMEGDRFDWSACAPPAGPV